MSVSEAHPHSDRPLYIYDNWSAYDELSDHVLLTEELALFQLDHLLRLKKAGVKFDAYLMDAFWYDRNGAYRAWHPDRWPNGPNRWLDSCQENGLMPGLWFPANTAFEMEPPARWADALADNKWGYCCFEGGFMDGFGEVLRHWYGQGVRVFKFDFADFGAAVESAQRRMLPSEIRAANTNAYRKSLKQFKLDCPEGVLCAYNGFEEAEYMTWTDRPLKKVLDPKWLEVFDSIYCGDPRPADLPLANFWRTLDVYADHMIWFLKEGGIPLDRIDNCAFMIGQTGTCYRRGKADWRSSLLLSLARGGRIHMTLGNLENLNDEDAEFFAFAQRLYEGALYRSDSGCSAPHWFGGVPGNGEIYGYESGSLLTIVNSNVLPASVKLNALPRWVEGNGKELSYSEGELWQEGENLNLAGGAMAVLSPSRAPEHFPSHWGGGWGEDRIFLRRPADDGNKAKISESDKDSDTEVLRDSIPLSLYPLPLTLSFMDALRAHAQVVPEVEGDLHVVFRQFDSKGLCVRTSGGSPPNGKRSSELLTIRAQQGGKELCVYRPADEIIWSGISWAYGILKCPEASVPIEIQVATSDQRVERITVEAYQTAR